LAAPVAGFFPAGSGLAAAGAFPGEFGFVSGFGRSSPAPAAPPADAGGSVPQAVNSRTDNTTKPMSREDVAADAELVTRMRVMMTSLIDEAA
jgi:hypothetical protein